MEGYAHRQVAMWYWALALAVILALWLLRLAEHAAAPGGFSLVGVFIVIVAAIFSQLTTVVDGVDVRWMFGWGWPAGQLALAQIRSVEIVQTNLMEGFGIHLTIWHGWLWNAGGFRAVQLTKIDGTTVTLGTDDPEGLYDAIVTQRKLLT